MKQEKRYLSVEEYTKGNLFSVIWLCLFLETMFILYIMFSFNSNPFVDFGIIFALLWIVTIIIFPMLIFLFLSMILTQLFERKFRKLWIDYYYERRTKYYESKIKKSLTQRLIFLIFSIIINVLTICFAIYFR